MSDISAFGFPYQGINVPNPQPLYPYVISGEGPNTRMSFNQGYVFDFQSQTDGAISKVTIQGCDQEYQVAGKRFFVKVQTPTDNSAISSAQITEGASGSYNFHYSARDLPNGSDVYSNGEGEFFIPLCDFDSLGGLTNIYLRENIHWQKNNYENIGYGEPILYSWGQDSSIFNAGNPSVKFRSVSGVGNVSVWGDGGTLFISGGESSSTGVSDDSGSKTAIVPFQNEYIGWVCMESPEAWFFDIIEVPITGRRTNYRLSPEILHSCEKGSISVVSVQGVDKPCRATANVLGANLQIKVKNLFRPKSVKVFIYGIRKNHVGRFKRYAREQYESNKAFYLKAHRPSV